MRNIIFLTFFLAIFGCNSNQPADVKLKQEPFDQIYFQRAYPDQVMDFKEMENVTHKVSQELSAKSIVDAEWLAEGPGNIGGRINAIAVDQNNSDIIFVGNSAGGIFRTTNGGTDWLPVADDFSYLSVGSIVISNQNSNVIYAGTGDPNISGLPHVGNGVYKSIDGGDTWEHKGLELPRIVSRLVLDPNDDQTIYAATMGLPFERNDDRGLYKSIDGGDSWTQILFVSDEAGITDLVINPSDPSILYASSWTRIRNNTESIIIGEDAHIYKSENAGETWEILTNGLPDGEQGRIGLTISQSNPEVLYTVYVGIDSQIEGIYKTTDSGSNWTAFELPAELNNALGGFGWYFAQIRVSPFDDNEVSVLGVDLYTTYNSGETWEMSTPPWWNYTVHADKHDLFYINQSTILLATDGGLYRSEDHFQSWQDIENIPNTQFYRVTVNPHESGIYTGGAQDNGTTTGSASDMNNWNRDYGGDGFQAIYHPQDDNVRYAETQNGNINKSINGGSSWSDFNAGIDSDDRTNWDTPLLMSPHNSEILYTGTYRVYKNEDEFWEPISDDVTDGVIFGDRYHTTTTIDESPIQEGFLYVGTTDGNVSRSLNGGADWENVSNGLPDRYVTNVKASPFDANTVFVTHSGFKDNDNVSHVHRSDDNGDSWVDISGDLIEQPINNIEIYNETTYFIATDFGVYVTVNSGVNWERVGDMPLIPVFDITIDEDLNRLIAGTFARSIQSVSIDDLLDEINVGLDDNIQTQQSEVYPNPASHEILLTGYEGKWFYSWYTLNGELLVANTSLEKKVNFDLSSFKPGVYILVITNKEGSKSHQVVVER